MPGGFGRNVEDDPEDRPYLSWERGEAFTEEGGGGGWISVSVAVSDFSFEGGEVGFGWGGAPPVGRLGELAAVRGVRSGVPRVGDEDLCSGLVGSRRPASMRES